jgi:hypothetical protein
MKCHACGANLAWGGGASAGLDGATLQAGKPLPCHSSRIVWYCDDCVAAAADPQYPMSVELREARGQALRWRRCALALLAGMPGAAGRTLDQLRQVIGLEDLEAQLGLVVRTCTTCGAEHTGTGSACDDCEGGGR